MLVTRPESGSADLASILRDAGAEVRTLPLLRIDDPPDLALLRAAAEAIDRYDWIVLTSANAVPRLVAAIEAARGRGGPLDGLRIAAIGPATAEAVRRAGGHPALVPEAYRGEALADALVAADPNIEGARILLARAAIARSVLPERLRAAGAEVDDVPAYGTVVEEASRGPLREIVESDSMDWITFASSSAVDAWVRLVGARTGGARIAAIGPITGATVRELGLPEPVIAEEHTRGGLVRAIAEAAGRPAPAGAAGS